MLSEKLAPAKRSEDGCEVEELGMRGLGFRSELKFAVQLPGMMDRIREN